MLCQQSDFCLELLLFTGRGNGNPPRVLAWEIPWTEEPGGLQPIMSQRVGHD